MTETKEARNARVQARWDELMAEGKHGHYETLFRIVREEVERERDECARLAERAAWSNKNSGMLGPELNCMRIAQEITARHGKQD